MVTLYVRVWIETVMLDRARISLIVTLYVRVWIETPYEMVNAWLR